MFSSFILQLVLHEKGNFIGDVFPGLGFILIVLWSIMSAATWFFVALVRHQPLISDFNIPLPHLRNFDHTLISISLFAYVSFALALDRRASMKEPARHVVTTLLGSVALGQEFLLFRLHFIDHVDDHHHLHLLLLQFLILTPLSVALLSIYHPTSVIFQGTWMMTIGFLLWTAGLIPKGYYTNLASDIYMVRFHAEMAGQQANSLLDVLFPWLLILLTVFSLFVYLSLGNIYSERVDYQSLIKDERESTSML